MGYYTRNQDTRRIKSQEMFTSSQPKGEEAMSIKTKVICKVCSSELDGVFQNTFTDGTGLSMPLMLFVSPCTSCLEKRTESRRSQEAFQKRLDNSERRIIDKVKKVFQEIPYTKEDGCPDSTYQPHPWRKQQTDDI